MLLTTEIPDNAYDPVCCYIHQKRDMLKISRSIGLQAMPILYGKSEDHVYKQVP